MNIDLKELITEILQMARKLKAVKATITESGITIEWNPAESPDDRLYITYSPARPPCDDKDEIPRT